jgi:hypothetical protein
VTASRESIYAALFAIGRAAPSLKTSSRRARLWTDVPASEQPALFQMQLKEDSAPDAPGKPYKWVLRVEWGIYVNSGDDALSIPSQQLNPILDYVEKQIPPWDAYGCPQRLGGLVYDCRIEGTIEIFEGALGPQAIAIVPIRIVAI